MKECIYCFKQIEDSSKWCGMSCKRLFLVENYDPMATIRTMSEEHHKHFEEQKKALKKMEESGLSASEYILGTNKDAKGEKVE